MKIGIVSFYDTQENYGQVLQCYALQKFLRNLGHTPFHLRYIEFYSKSKIAKLFKLIKYTLQGVIFDFAKMVRQNNLANKDLTFLKDGKIRERGFDKFRKDYISLSDKKMTLPDLKKEKEMADAWITGSDQVWGCGPSELFHLQFVSPDKKRIAYAASMGGLKLENKFQRKYFKKYIQSFDRLTLREEDGVNQCKALGITNAELVLDPTFLVTAGEYNKMIPPTLYDEPYVFLYLLGNPIDLELKEVYKWAESQHLKVKYCAAQGRVDDYAKIYPSPTEWLGLIRDADYVITNSFHGMAFSIIFNKRFLVIPISKAWSKMNSRLTTTLDTLGIARSRIFSGDLESIKSSIDYKDVNEKLTINREKEALIMNNLLSARNDESTIHNTLQ